MNTSPRKLIIPGFILLCIIENASAYLDPGTGSYIFQLLIASFLGVGFLMRNWLGRIKGKILSIFTKKGK